MGEKFKFYYETYGEEIKKFGLPIAVILALVCFWIFGGDSEDVIEITDHGGEYSTELDLEEESFHDESVSDIVIYVDIGGEVLNPGVYELTEGMRLFQAIELAGGLTDTADTDSINQAMEVIDGEKIIIGSVDENSPYYTGSGNLGSTESSSGTGGVRETENGPVVNINKASLEELQEIPGVGPSTAQKILDYRNENGLFKNLEDLKNISGIGDKTFENMREYIEI